MVMMESMEEFADIINLGDMKEWKRFASLSSIPLHLIVFGFNYY